MNNLRARLFTPVLRGLERVLPAPVYCGLLYPVAWVRALIHRGIKGRPPIAWPTGLGGMPTGKALALPRLPVYLNRTFEFLPDRLAEPKWRGYCRFIGLEPVKRLVDAGRPVIRPPRPVQRRASLRLGLRLRRRGRSSCRGRLSAAEWQRRRRRGRLLLLLLEELLHIRRGHATAGGHD